LLEYVESGYKDWTAAAIGIVTVIIITIICVVGIVYISKCGGVEKS